MIKEEYIREVGAKPLLEVLIHIYGEEAIYEIIDEILEEKGVDLQGDEYS